MMTLARLQYVLFLMLASFIVGASGGAAQNQPASFVEGQHYQKLATPVRTSNPDKIEVTVVFWYGCAHCYRLEQSLKQWKRNWAPDDVAFVDSPAMWRQDMKTHARIYYTSKALGVLDTMHDAAYDAMQIRNLRLLRNEEIKSVYAQNGVSTDRFEQTFNSFGVSSQVRQAEARARSYGIQGAPEIIVDGKYRVSERMAGSQQGMLAVVEHLVAKIRQERGGADAN